MIGKKRNEDEAAPEEDKKIDGESRLYGFRAVYVFELSASFVHQSGFSARTPDNNISNDVGRVKVLGVVFFMISNTLCTSARRHWFPSRE